MFPDDYPLLSDPSLTTLILHLAEAGDISAETCAARLAALLAQAHEPPPLPAEAIAARLAAHIGQLAIAGLLVPVTPGVWALTDRGRAELRRHPDGTDASDLARYPEYAAHIRNAAGGAAQADPRAVSYDEGYEARRDGRPYTANPHPPSTADYLSWENGWMQALDDEKPA